MQIPFSNFSATFTMHKNGFNLCESGGCAIQLPNHNDITLLINDTSYHNADMLFTLLSPFGASIADCLQLANQINNTFV